MGSIGSGELLVIAVVALLALDPKTAGRWWAKMRRIQRRLLDVREDFEREVRSSLEPEQPRRESAQDRLRRWAAERVRSLGQTEWDEAPERLLKQLRDWEVYQKATQVGAFWPLDTEIPLEPVLRGMQADGKQLWLPWLTAEPGIMEMASVNDLEEDLEVGPWQTRQPKESRRGQAIPSGALVLVPGSVFDLLGARVGKGKGYYDRWLAANPQVMPVGACWDAQVHPGRLPTSPHDHPMQALLSEHRLVTFAPPPGLAGPAGRDVPHVADPIPPEPLEEEHA